jgi:dienelactone hydrolase
MPSDSYRVFSDGPEERLAAYYARMTDPKPLRATTKAGWIERRKVLRPLVQKALGLDPMPDRLPLEIRTGGKQERDGYSVERLYWQTWPQVWASGWLYLPAEVEGRLPAVLNPHGHFENGARHPTVQSRLISLAKLGYVTLAVDSVHLYDYAVGVTPLTVMTWNNLRALDLLTARPDVDRERIGLMGASGGAQQAMYLMALDDRPRAAVLAVMVSYSKRILSSQPPHHCGCNHVPGLMRFTDEPELCAIPSPRAIQYLTVDQDWTESFQDHELGELRAIYRLWGQEDRLDHQQFPGPHDFPRPMREAGYTWLERELRGNRKAEPVAEPEHRTETPEALAALDAAPPEDVGVGGIVEWYRKRVIHQPPHLESRQSRRTYHDDLRGALRGLLGEVEPVALDDTWAASPEPGIIRVSFQSEADVRVPALWAPAEGDGPHPTVIAAHPDGKAAALEAPLVQELRRGGWSVLAPDLRLRGEMHREWLPNTLIWGRPEAGMAADDLRAAVQFLYQQASVDYRSVVLLGLGDQGLPALFAAAFDERVSGVIADAGGTTYRDGGEGLAVIPNILRHADVPQIAGLTAPRPLWLYNVPKERTGFSSRRYFDWTRRTFQSLGDEEALKLDTQPASDPAAVLAWLTPRLRKQARKA